VVEIPTIILPEPEQDEEEDVQDKIPFDEMEN
jgi:hypothetical protein